MLTNWRSFKSLVSPVISVTVHSDIQGALSYPDILFSLYIIYYLYIYKGQDRVQFGVYLLHFSFLFLFFSFSCEGMRVFT